MIGSVAGRIAGVILAGVMVAGCQTTAQTSTESGNGAVQMAREAMQRGDVYASTRAPAPRSQMPPRIYLMRGLANVFSQGMDDLGAKLQARGYNATVHTYGEWSAITAEILENQRATNGRFQAVVIGHSLGANAVTDVTNALARSGGQVSLAVAFDPTVHGQVAGGARRFVNLYQSNNGWGTTIVAAPGYRGRLENIDLRQQGGITHFNIDKDPRLHAQVIQWIGQAVGAPRRVVGR